MLSPCCHRNTLMLMEWMLVHQDGRKCMYLITVVGKSVHMWIPVKNACSETIWENRYYIRRMCAYHHQNMGVTSAECGHYISRIWVCHHQNVCTSSSEHGYYIIRTWVLHHWNVGIASSGAYLLSEISTCIDVQGIYTGRPWLKCHALYVIGEREYIIIHFIIFTSAKDIWYAFIV